MRLGRNCTLAMSNHYDVLGCNENATFEEIKRRYQELILKSHPDKATASDSSKEIFIKINEAWQTLRDPLKRKAYDAQLLAEQCDSERVLYATLTWNEMDFIDGSYLHPCRCGSSYIIHKDDTMDTRTDLYYQCSECSLGILVKSV
ncbi:DPH4-like protein [Frankliniella fusca]|uniref:DPH4-like protein n=1 Tax=Frankliniella fusca TaxID=407009 RepID=A0AAE1GSP3_9NEOP|nr:DPH4-like protein [Frankliniella fusca]